MKRFILFTYYTYYPGGGLTDACGSYDTLEEAQAAASKELADHKEIFDCEEREEVWSN